MAARNCSRSAFFAVLEEKLLVFTMPFFFKISHIKERVREEKTVYENEKVSVLDCSYVDPGP